MSNLSTLHLHHLEELSLRTHVPDPKNLWEIMETDSYWGDECVNRNMSTSAL
jgi:hypothetical protein